MTELTPAEIHAKARKLYPPVTKDYVDSLANPLIRHMGEPPHDALTVLAIAVQAALYEALEMIELARYTLDKPQTVTGGNFSWMHAAGQEYAGTKVVRRVADALRLFHPGEIFTPGERILASRSAKGYGQVRLAEEVGVHRAHIAHLEKGRRKLTPAIAERLAPVLGVTAEYLLTGREGATSD